MKDIKALISPEFILGLLSRYRWLIMPPILLSILAGSYLVITLPRTYEAQTLILVEPQRVPSEFVRSVITSDINARVNTISQQILSRTNLEKIMREYNVFTDQKYDHMYPEDKLSALRKRISVNVTRARGGAAFSISYKGNRPERVVKIANTLAAYFIDENLKVREAQALGTSDFLNNELEQMRDKLETVESAMQQFRQTYMGELPEQLQTNLSILGRIQEQMSSRERELRGLRLRLADLKQEQSEQINNATISADTAVAGRDGVLSTTELYAQLKLLRSKYTEKHPDVIRIKKMLEERINQDNQSAPSQNGNQSSNYAGMAIKSELDRQIHELEKAIRAMVIENDELRNKINLYQHRIEDTPKREQELLALRRDYSNIQASYNSLLERKLEAEISVNMERKQKGEQFRILDTAKLPEKPISPNIKAVFVGSLVIGLGFGVGLSVLFELLNNSYQTANELETDLKLPVLTTIPTIKTQRQVSFARWNNIASVAFLCILFISFAGFAYFASIGADKTILAIKNLGSF